MNTYGHNLHLPYTCLVTKLRMSKRQSQTQMAEILKQIINLKNTSQLKTKEEILEQLKKSKAKLISFKDKLKSEKNQQAEIYNTCRKRVHLDKQVSQKKEAMTKQEIMQEFDKEVIQFFACRNRIKEAQMIQKSLKDNYYFDLYVQLYNKAFKISQAITKNDLRPLKDWCYQHSHYLIKIKSSLQFKLISCGFVNILNNTSTTKAIQFLRKEVATLSLTENDKEQINRLTFMVLMSSNQSEIQYYSDSDEQKERQKQKQTILLRNEQKIQNKIVPVVNGNGNKKNTVNQNQSESSSSSSSSANLNQALVATQQHMRSIYRAIVQIAQGAQGIINTVVNSMTMQVPEQRQPERNLQPHNIEVEVAQPQQQQEVEQVYEQNFDSLSEQEPNQKQNQGQMIQQQIQQKEKQEKKDKKIQSQTMLSKSLFSEESKKMQDYIQKAKKNMKTVIRKNKLEKNSLRSLLIQTQKQFISAFSKIYQISFDTFFDKTLAIGMSVLKTPSCNQAHGFDRIGEKRGNCPTCTKQVQRIIQKIPATLKNQSSLICRINGSLMNQINYPIALPNGQIYSIQGLKKTEKNGKYHCLAQKKWYRKQACKKVFLT